MNMNMSKILQKLLILLVCSYACYSKECYTKDAYTESERPSSCKDIPDKYPATPSGYYWIQASGQPTKVYCDMTIEHCGSKGG